MAIVGVNGRWGAATAAAKGKGYTQANGTLNRRRQHHRVRGMRKQNDWQGDCKWRGQRGESRRPGELHEDDHGHWHIDRGRPWRLRRSSITKTHVGAHTVAKSPLPRPLQANHHQIPCH